LRDYGEHGNTRAVAIKQAIYEMQVAWTGAAGADGKLAGKVRFSACREGSHFLVPNVYPLYLALGAKRLCKTVQAVADDTVDAFYSGRCQRFYELVRYRSHRLTQLL
jgi:hypothetical protein